MVTTVGDPEGNAAWLAWCELRNRIAAEAIEAWDRERPPCCFAVFVQAYGTKRMADIVRDN